MLEENPITGPGLAGSAGPSVATRTGPLEPSLLAGRLCRVICALVFFGVTKNYVDRQVVGVLRHSAARPITRMPTTTPVFARVNYVERFTLWSQG